MPNWTLVTLVFPDSETARRIHEENSIDGTLAFRKLIPFPQSKVGLPAKYIKKEEDIRWPYGMKYDVEENGPMWLDSFEWCIDNWGVKWDIGIDDYCIRGNKITFHCPWTIPTPVIKLLAQKYEITILCLFKLEDENELNAMSFEPGKAPYEMKP